MKHSGAIACGHAETARAAELILHEGGNAFDAVIAAFFSACVAEPVLASLGGGGFLLAHTRDHGDVIYDFFAQTPQSPLPEDRLNFYPIGADFGTTTQEFHIGLASPSSDACWNTSATSSRVAERGKFTVLDTALSVCS